MSFVFAPRARLSSGFGRRARFVAALTAALVVAGALVAASRLGSPEPARSPAASASAPDLFAGIPQDGAALGSKDAPVTLVEYADLQCPYCAEWAERTLPVLASDYVRAGKLRIVFRGLSFIGADSTVALRAVHAAGRQDRLWNLVHALYIRQGPENSGWASESLLTEAALGPTGGRLEPLVLRSLGPDGVTPEIDAVLAR